MHGFISYSHCDAERVARLRQNLDPVADALGVKFWIDDQIRAGAAWDREIEKALDQAELFLFCISPSLVNSEYVKQVELKKARAKCDRGEAVMVPVILRDCTWQWVEAFAEIQAVPKGGKAIDLWKPQGPGYADAARRIGAMLKDHLAAKRGEALHHDNPWHEERRGDLLQDHLAGKRHEGYPGLPDDKPRREGRPMTNAVMEAKARAKAAVVHWREARAGINDPDSVPARLDPLVAAAERAVATIGQDVVTEVEALVVELADLRFPVDPDDALSALERATMALDGALGRLSRAASRAGFAEAADDLHLPPGMRVPAAELADRLDAFVAAVEAIRPVLDEIASRQAQDQGGDARQAALVQNLIDRATVKLDILAIKTAGVGLTDVSGVAGLSRQLTALLQSFVATVAEGAAHLSRWLARAANSRITPVIAPITEDTLALVRRAAAWIRTRSGELPAGPPPFSVFRDRFADGGAGPELVVIPPGEFLMGSDESELHMEMDGRARDNEIVKGQGKRSMRIARGFALGRYPVTENEYGAFLAATSRQSAPRALAGRMLAGQALDVVTEKGRFPAVEVSWDDARAYCDWLNRMTGLQGDAGYRLPSEAEWEYACRAGTSTRRWWGDDWDPNRANGAGSFERGRTSPVGHYAPNPWGLCDMIGNVWEWGADEYAGNIAMLPTDGTPYESKNALSQSSLRVLRGGAWNDSPENLRSAARDWNQPDDRISLVGFRVARTLSPPTP